MSVSFNQSSYNVSEHDREVEFTLALSSPLGCNCYAQVMVTTVDVTAESKQFSTYSNNLLVLVFRVKFLFLFKILVCLLFILHFVYNYVR